MIEDKIKNLSSLKKIVTRIKKQDKTIVFTNGCFDILHLGHIKYLEEAKKQGDILIVAVNSDSSVRKIKPGRPINKELDRQKVLASLSSVDYVVLFNQETPLNLIKAIKPDILIKGGDWKPDKVVGKNIVECYGGKVKIINYLKGYSTTNLLKKIIRKAKTK
ncbi:MAG: D-glycero-beta-D-manno-heptose 1-phosphate adenylyltransferase [Candidatus Omnitrophota bacterium]